jgi:hypothetical protein
MIHFLPAIDIISLLPHIVATMSAIAGRPGIQRRWDVFQCPGALPSPSSKGILHHLSEFHYHFVFHI